MKCNKKKVMLWTLVFFMLFITFHSSLSLPDWCDQPPCSQYKDLKVKSLYAEVDFLDDIYSQIDENTLKGEVKITNGKVKVDHPHLKTTPAKITFYLSAFKNPIILRDGVLDESIVPVQKDLTTWEITVPHFSTYEILENKWLGTRLNVTITNGNLTFSKDAEVILQFNANSGTQIFDNSTNKIVFNTTAIFNSSGKFHGARTFNGSNTDFLNLRNLSFGTTANITDLTVSIWVNPSEMTPTITKRLITKYTSGGSTAGSIVLDINAGGFAGKPRFLFSNSSDVLEIFQTNTVLESDKWTMITATFNNGLVNFYINDTLVLFGNSVQNYIPAYGLNWSVASDNGHIGTNFNGSLDVVKIIPRAVTPQEVTAMYFNNYMQKYPTNGTFSNYSITTNYDPAIERNVIYSARLNSSDCSRVQKLTINNTLLTKAGCLFTLPTPLVTDRWNLNITFNEGSGETFQITSYNLTMNRTYVPSVHNLSIYFVGASGLDPLSANVSFSLNDTDAGTMNITWFINGIFAKEDIINGLTAGKNATSNLLTGYNKGDLVWYNATPSVNGVYGNNNGSAKLTIANAGFNVTWKPDGNSTTVKAGTQKTFSAQLTDIDGDVNVTWYVNGVETYNGTVFVYSALFADAGNTVYVVGNATDYVYEQTHEWTVSVSESNLALGMISVMIFLSVMVVLFGLATWYFDMGLKFFFLLLTFLSILVGLNISAQIADTLSATVAGVLWTVYKVGLFIFMFLFFVVLVKLISELKLRRNAMNTDNLDSPGNTKQNFR